MLEILGNPVTLSVIVMCVLCLLKLNVILSLLVAAMVALPPDWTWTLSWALSSTA